MNRSELFDCEFSDIKPSVLIITQSELFFSLKSMLELLEITIVTCFDDLSLSLISLLDDSNFVAFIYYLLKVGVLIFG